MRTGSSSGDSELWQSWGLFCASALTIVAAFVLGGASRENALQTMIVELVSIPALVLAIWRVLKRGTSSAAWWPMAVLSAMFLVPILQMVSVPAGIWSTLPGREAAAGTFRAAGVPLDSLPASLAPAATMNALVWLLPPAAVFLSILTMTSQQRKWLVGIILAACVGSLLLGGMQVSTGDESIFRLYRSTHAYLPIGFFANRNHQGILMAIGIVFAACYATTLPSTSRDSARLRSIVYVGLIGLLAVGVLVTRSRAALVLGGPALIVSLTIFWNGTTDKGLRKVRTWAVFAAAIVLVVATQAAVAAVLSRFKDLAGEEGRFEAWPTVIEAARAVQPVGGGVGSFDPLYRLFEPMGLIGPFFLNHAHNDYLELWLEAGLAFPILFVAFCIWFARMATATWISPAGSGGSIARAASMAVLMLLLHSVADYPLRTPALACLFAMSLALMIPTRAHSRYSQP